MFISNDPQELFDTAYSKIIEQGTPAIKGKHCFYQLEDGRRCAASHCLTDEVREFASELESVDGSTALEDIIDKAERDEVMDAQMVYPTPDTLYLMNNIQEAHDSAAMTFHNNNSAFIHRFKKNMCKIADEWGLLVHDD